MGLIRKSVSNRVAANMLMLLLLAGGLIASFQIPRELFPEFELDIITVTVPYPGESPSEIEEGICLKIEDQLRGQDGVEEMTSISREGVGTVMLELYEGADAREVLDEVQSEIDKIEFPDEAEDPIVVEQTLRREVINVAVAGDVDEHTLRAKAEEIRDEINDLPDVSQVELSGVRDYEVSVELTEEARRRYGLTLEQVAQAIRQSSLDLPAGSVESPTGDYNIRIVGRRYTAEEYKTIPVISKAAGATIRLGEVANVRETFEDVDIGGQFDGRRAALVIVYKTAEQDSLAISDAVNAYVDRKRAELPDSIRIAAWADRSKVVRDRLSMLIGDGFQGLVFVVLILWLFLGLRLAFWVALGIPISILSTILVLDATGMTLNMMSMFALIMALGLIVDDAIVVGENIYTQIEKGEPPIEAAIKGTLQVLLPVVGAVVTTWLAFMPMLFIPGVMGKFIEILPTTVILALAFSLVECLLILPPHLGHSLRHRQRSGEHKGRVRRTAARLRERIDGGIHWVIHRAFARAYDLAARYRYVTVAIVVGILLLAVGAFKGGRIRVTPFPKVGGDTLVASLTMSPGTPIERTREIASDISAASRSLNEEYRTRGGDPVVVHTYTLLGSGIDPAGGGDAGAHVATVIVELAPSESREQSSEELVDAWRERTGVIPGAQELTFGARAGGPGGKALEIRVLGRETEQAKDVAEAIQRELSGYPGVTDISDDTLPGKMEMRIRLQQGATNLGVTRAWLAQRVREAFEGVESLTVQRGRNEVEIVVRYAESQRRSLDDVESMRIRTPAGAEVPFSEVAVVDMERGYTTLRRVGGRRVVTVSADVQENVANAEEIIGDLRGGGFFERQTREHPGVTVDLRGQRRQLFESLDALFVWFPLALMGIYTILAGIFRSYVQPVIIMIAIPFGLVGAVVGHWIVGYDVTLLSLFGMVALTGIVVNDSLVLIDTVNRRSQGGETPEQAARGASLARFRPIILTTATTVAGVTPLLYEQSFQAQFLKPMAVSLAFGLLFATALTLLVVPSMYLIGHDIRRAWSWLRRSE